MSHEIAETDANLAEIVRLYADLASAQEAIGQAERALTAERYARRRVESTVRDWVAVHPRGDGCPACDALHRIARGEA